MQVSNACAIIATKKIFNKTNGIDFYNVYFISRLPKKNLGLVFSGILLYNDI